MTCSSRDRTSFATGMHTRAWRTPSQRGWNSNGVLGRTEALFFPILYYTSTPVRSSWLSGAASAKSASRESNFSRKLSRRMPCSKRMGSLATTSFQRPMRRLSPTAGSTSPSARIPLRIFMRKSRLLSKSTMAHSGKQWKQNRLTMGFSSDQACL